MPNLFTSLPDLLPGEITDVLVQARRLRIERIVSQGQSSPAGFWYDQEENGFVLLVQGAARLRFEDELVELKAGDWINIPAHSRHRIEWTTPSEKSMWLAVFYE